MPTKAVWGGALGLLVLAVSIGFLSWSVRAVHRPLPPSPQAATSPALRALEARQLRFERNVGQAPGDVRYLSRGRGHELAVFDDGMALSVPGRASAQLRFVNARTGGQFEEREPVAARSNYLQGSDAARWVRNVPQLRQLRYTELYRGIDLVYYSRDGELEFDLVVRPGVDPAVIQLQASGAKKPFIDADGHLLLDGEGGVLRVHRPVLHQSIEGQRITLDARWVLGERGALSFDLPAYDKRYPLVIDPVFKLLYSSYLTGFHDEQVGGMVLDAQGNAYVVGHSNSDDFSVSGNAFQPNRATSGLRYNVVVTKFDAAGLLLYATYLGGSDYDFGSAIAVDAAGNAYVTGNTTSADFPVTAGAHQPTFKGRKSAYLAVLSPDGSALAYSTFYGSSASEVQARGVALDATGAPVLAGTAGPGLTTTAGAYKGTLATGNAAFVARFSPLASGVPQLVAASYYGVDNPQPNNTMQGVDALGMALDASGAPWFTGQAFTTNLPLTAGALQRAPTAMSQDCAQGPAPLNGFAFVAKLSADLRSLAYASYLSGRTEPAGASTCSEFGRTLTLDAAGNVYVVGSTGSASFPTTGGALQPTSPAGSGFGSYVSFVTKFNPDASAILWSSYFGGNVGTTFITSMALGPASNSLWVGAVTGGGNNYPITPDALQTVLGGGNDAGFAQFDLTTGALKHSTFLGGNGNDTGLAIAVDAAGNAFVAGATLSTNFPLSANAYERTFRPDLFGGADWFVTVMGNGTIGSLSRSTAGNAGDTTIVVNGSGIVAGAVATLVAADGSTVATRSVAIADNAGRWPFTFLLDGAALGSYDLVVRNPDGTELRKPAAVTVAAGEGPKLSMAIVGRSTVRIGTPASYQLTLTNSGDSDAYYALVRVGLPPGVRAKYRFGPSVAAFPGDTTDYGAIPGTVTQDGVDYTMVLFPVIPAGRTGSVSVEINAPDDAPIEFEAVLLPSYLPSFQAVRGAVGLAAERAFALALGREQPLITRPQASQCASSVILLLAGAAATAAALSPAGVLAASMAVLTGVIASSLVAGPSGQSLQGQGIAAAQNAAQSFLSNELQNVLSIANVVNDCDPDRSLRERLIHAITPRASVDPNDKSGPSGDGSAAHYLKSAPVLPYQIAFENLASAGLPAAEVVVTDVLDVSKYNLGTLTLGSISWGPHRIDVPPGLNAYSTVYNIDATISVRVAGSLNPTTGVLKWTFTTLDPATHLPPSDPTLGFLPPNVNGTQGQGYVNFTVAPKAGLPEGTKWENFASIVFDTNAPIVTPTWVNTLDTTRPVGRVASATQRSDSTDVDVAWAATDAGSGARTYTVYVSDDGGAYSAWQSAVSTTSAVFAGTVGHTYRFYVIATDGAGNTEAAKSAAEASVTVSDPANSGGGGGGGCTIGGANQRDASLVLLVLAALVLRWRRRASALFAASSSRRARR